MELSFILKILLIGICLFALIFFIFGLAKIDWDTDVDEVLNLYRNELTRSKNELDEGNKTIDKLEKEILICKKKLKIDLFNDNN